jgi:hypothetical protein
MDHNGSTAVVAAQHFHFAQNFVCRDAAVSGGGLTILILP